MTSLNFWSIILLGLALYNFGMLAYEQMIRLGSALSTYLFEVSLFGTGGLYLGLRVRAGGIYFWGQGLALFFVFGDLGMGVWAFLVGGQRAFANFIEASIELRMGSAIPSPFGFSSYSYGSGVRISWWEISLACPGYCTQTVIVFLGRCQEYKSLKLNSIIVINDYQYYQLSFSSIIIALHRKPNYGSS